MYIFKVVFKIIYLYIILKIYHFKLDKINIAIITAENMYGINTKNHETLLQPFLHNLFSKNVHITTYITLNKKKYILLCLN